MKADPVDQLFDLVWRALLLLQNSYGIVILSYDSNGRTDKKVYVHIPQSTRGKRSSNKDSHKKKAKMLEIILKMISEIPRGQYSVLVQTAKSLGLEVAGWKKDLEKTSAKEAVAFLRFVRLSAQDDVCKVNKFFRSIKGINLFPAQLFKTLVATIEKAFTIIQPQYFMAISRVFGGTWETQSPSWSGSYPSRSTITSFRYLPSSPPLHQYPEHDLHCFWLRYRGGESTTMLFRLWNREGGNSAAYFRSIYKYEDGAECYSDIAATVYSEKKRLQELMPAKDQ